MSMVKWISGSTQYSCCNKCCISYHQTVLAFLIRTLIQWTVHVIMRYVTKIHVEAALTCANVCAFAIILCIEINFCKTCNIVNFIHKMLGNV